MTNTIRFLLVDDEYLALNLLENFAKEVPGMQLIAKTKSPMDALNILNEQEIDLLFLDIQMPKLSGVNLLKTLKRPPLTIFTTAYSDYAVDAFGLDAVDYLVKPFSFERFLQAVNKAKKVLSGQRNRVVATPSLTAPTSHFISIKSDARLVKIDTKDIVYIEGLKEYVRIVCTNEKRYVTLMSMKQLLEDLPATDFMRVHKSYIVNIAMVQSLEGNLLHLVVDKVPVSRDKKNEVISRIF